MTTHRADDDRARDTAQVIEPVPSPCINLCRMNPATGLCEGCLRTIDEIASWSRFDDAARRAVWDEIDRRHAGFIADQAHARDSKT
jgi:hypothetical protein